MTSIYREACSTNTTTTTTTDVNVDVDVAVDVAVDGGTVDDINVDVVADSTDHHQNNIKIAKMQKHPIYLQFHY